MVLVYLGYIPKRQTNIQQDAFFILGSSKVFCSFGYCKDFFSFEMNGCFKIDVRRNMVRYVWILKTFRVAPEDLTALRKLLPPKYRELVSWKIFLANILLFPIK